MKANAPQTTRFAAIFLALIAAAIAPVHAQINGVNDNVVSANLDNSGFYTLPTITGLGGDLTVEGWVFLRSYANWGRIADLGSGENSNNILLTTVGTTGRPGFSIRSGGTELGFVEGANALGTNTWVHVAGVLQPDRTMRLYVNGAEVATATASGDVPVMDRTSNYVGESNWAADALLDGAVADVRFWNTARTQAEIQNNMPVGSVTGPTTGLVAAYAFGATGAAPTADLSGNGYTATQNGNILYSKFDTGTLTTGGFSGANLNVAEGQLNLTGSNSVGRLSVNSATVTQAAGSSVTTTGTGAPEPFQVGVSAGQTGSYAISGGTLDVANSGVAFIGASGTGSITQTGGAVSTDSWTVLGRFAGGTGNYDISGGTLSHSATDTGSKIIVGEEGTGTLTVSGSGEVSTVGGLSIAHAAGGVGTVNLNGGTIATSGVSKGSGTSATFNFNGGTLEATGNNNNFMSGLDVAEIKAGGAVIDDAGFEIGIGQVLSGTGSLGKTGSGRLTLSGNNTYAGTTTISEGILRVGNDGTTGTLGSGDVINNATLAFARSDALTVSQAISGTGEVRKWGFGTTTFTGANTFTGDFRQEYGVTVLNRIGGPALYADGGPGELVIANLAGGANFYSAVEMGAANQLGSNVDVTFSPINVTDGYSYLSLHGNDTTIGNLKSTANHAAAWGVIQNQESGSFGDSTLTIHQTVDGSFTGEIRDGFGANVGRLALVKEGAATLTLDSAGGVGLAYTGATTVNGGRLQLDASTGDKVYAGGAVAINNGSTLAFSGGRYDWNTSGGSAKVVTFGASGGNTLDTGTSNNVVDWVGNTYRTTGGARNFITGSSGLNLNSGVTATLDVARGTDPTSDLTVSSFFWNGGGIAKTGNGIATLSGSSTYSGGTTISAGTLQVGNGGTSGTLGSGSVTNNGTLAFNRSDNTTVGNNISGTGSVSKLGSGTMTLNGTSTYTGATTVNAGGLNVNGSIAGSAVTVNSGASLSGSGAVGAISGAGSINPGNSPGILTATSLDPAGGMSFNFEFTSINPVYADASSSSNDLLRLTASTPFTASLTSANTVNIFFNVADLVDGTSYSGGFFTDSGVGVGNLIDSIVDANVNYYVRGDGNGTDATYEGAGYYTLSNYDSGLAVVADAVTQGSADFAGGTVVDGAVTQFNVVPEPSTYALLTLGAAALAAHAWRKRQRAKAH